jgi:hypothetical protein
MCVVLWWVHLWLLAGLAAVRGFCLYVQSFANPFNYAPLKLGTYHPVAPCRERAATRLIRLLRSHPTEADDGNLDAGAFSRHLGDNITATR